MARRVVQILALLTLIALAVLIARTREDLPLPQNTGPVTEGAPGAE